MTKRIEHIDIARGIGILLVVLGHNDFGQISPLGHQIIFSFHMPLFFFLSGYFFNPAIGFLDLLKRRFHSILKPYLFTILLIYFASVSFETMSFQTAILRVIKSLYGSSYYLDWAPLWFLPNLFVVSLYAFAFYMVVGKLNNRALRWFILIVTLSIGILLLKSFYPFSFGESRQLFGLPFGLDLVLVSGFFFMLGSEIREIASEENLNNLFLLIGAGVILFLLNYFFDARVDLAARIYESFVINTLEAIAGIFFVLALARQIELRTPRLVSPLKYIGQISIIILLFHLPIQDYWAKKIFAVTDNRPLSIWVGFVIGVTGSILIYELFIKQNPVASYWFGRQAVLPEKKEPAAADSS